MWIWAAIHWPSMFTRQRAPCCTNILTKSWNLCEGKYHTPSQTEKLRSRRREGLVQGHSLVSFLCLERVTTLPWKPVVLPFHPQARFLPCDLGQGLGMPVGPHPQDLLGLRQGGAHGGKARDVNLSRVRETVSEGGCSDCVEHDDGAGTPSTPTL